MDGKQWVMTFEPTQMNILKKEVTFIVSLLNVDTSDKGSSKCALKTLPEFFKMIN